MMDAKYVAPMVAYLTTDQAWNVNGKVFYVQGGVVSLAHEEAAFRSIDSPGMWTVEDLRAHVPGLLTGIVNPAPPAPDVDLPMRPAITPE